MIRSIFSPVAELRQTKFRNNLFTLQQRNDGAARPGFPNATATSTSYVQETKMVCAIDKHIAHTHIDRTGQWLTRLGCLLDVRARARVRLCTISSSDPWERKEGRLQSKRSFRNQTLRNTGRCIAYKSPPPRSNAGPTVSTSYIYFLQKNSCLV